MIIVSDGGLLAAIELVETMEIMDTYVIGSEKKGSILDIVCLFPLNFRSHYVVKLLNM